MKRPNRVYNIEGKAGCVLQKKARQTGTLVGVYNAEQAGIDSEPTDPWASVCETHGTFVCHSSLQLAKAHSADPKGWCDHCRESAP